MLPGFRTIGFDVFKSTSVPNIIKVAVSIWILRPTKLAFVMFGKIISEEEDSFVELAPNVTIFRWCISFGVK